MRYVQREHMCVIQQPLASVVWNPLELIGPDKRRCCREWKSELATDKIHIKDGLFVLGI